MAGRGVKQIARRRHTARLPDQPAPTEPALDGLDGTTHLSHLFILGAQFTDRPKFWIESVIDMAIWRRYFALLKKSYVRDFFYSLNREVLKR